MKNNYLIVMALLVFLSGCVAAIQLPTPHPFVAGVAPTLTQWAFETTSAIDATPIESATPNPDLTNPEDLDIVFLDEFDETLQPGWEWTNEDPATWSLVNAPGNLQIQSEFGQINLGSAKNLLLRNVPGGNFMFESRIKFSPDRNDQFAGMVLYGSRDNFIQAGLGYCAPAVVCVKQGFYIETYRDGKIVLPGRLLRYNDDVISIRMIVQNGELGLFISLDDNVWYRTAQQPLAFAPVKIGLFSGQNSHPAIIPAVFEYFEVRKLEE